MDPRPTTPALSHCFTVHIAAGGTCLHWTRCPHTTCWIWFHSRCAPGTDDGCFLERFPKTCNEDMLPPTCANHGPHYAAIDTFPEVQRSLFFKAGA
eukprot:3938568-Amphidinium_carterae.1